MKIILYPIFYLFYSACVNFSFAQDYNTFTEDMVEVKFISAVTKVKKENFYIALDFNLKPGWKIYWRQPGDSGLPPNLDYKNSTNLKSLEFKWPFPLKEYEAANLLTNPVLDPWGKIPEFKFCAVNIEKIPVEKTERG